MKEDNLAVDILRVDGFGWLHPLLRVFSFDIELCNVTVSCGLAKRSVTAWKTLVIYRLVDMTIIASQDFRPHSKLRR